MAEPSGEVRRLSEARFAVEGSGGRAATEVCLAMPNVVVMAAAFSFLGEIGDFITFDTRAAKDIVGSVPELLEERIVHGINAFGKNGAFFECEGVCRNVFGA